MQGMMKSRGWDWDTKQIIAGGIDLLVQHPMGLGKERRDGLRSKGEGKMGIHAPWKKKIVMSLARDNTQLRGGKKVIATSGKQRRMKGMHKWARNSRQREGKPPPHKISLQVVTTWKCDLCAHKN